METIIIWHDNRTGCTFEKCGYTEYTAEEVEKAGGIGMLLKSYKDAGFKVFRVQ